MLAVIALLAWIDGKAIAQWIFNAALGAGLAYMATKTRKIEKLEERLGEKAEQLVTVKFDAHASGLKGSIDLLTTQITAINQRIEDGDECLDGLAKGDHRLELQQIQSLAELKVWVMQNAATTADVKELGGRVDRLQHVVSTAMVARIENAADLIERAAKSVGTHG